ncbi:MAG TPA: FxSxx-COOH system tetratricopeptide repeat protein [Chloroflexia bacterium]
MSTNRSSPFAKLLKMHRNRANWTQQELAVDARVSVRTIQDLEAGRVLRPRPITLRCLVTALGLEGADRATFEAAARGEALVSPNVGQASSRRIFLVPHFSNPLFVGRTDYLEQLHKNLLDDGNPTALAGIGGIGKTQLAVEFAYRYQDRFPGGVFWITMETEASIPNQIAAFANPDGLDIQDRAGMSFSERIAAVRQAWQQPDLRLLIFDALQDPGLLRRWRPHGGGSQVLITTKRLSWPAISGLRVIRLSTLGRPASLELLLTPRANKRAVDVDQLVADPASSRAANDICEELGDLPLALALAAAYLETYESVTLEGYYAELQRTLLEHRSLNINAALSEGLPTEHARGVAATFALTYDKLQPDNATDRLALTLLHQAAHCAPGAIIPRPLLVRASWLEVGASEAGTETDLALLRLATLGLIEPLPDGSQRLHRLLAAFARGRSPHPRKDRVALEEALVVEVEAITQSGHPWAGRTYLEHLRHLIKTSGKRRDAAVARLNAALGLLLHRQGDLAAARPFLERALDIRQVMLGMNDPDTVESLEKLGWLLAALGEGSEARALLERVLAIRQQVLGPRALQVATTLNRLSTLLRDQGDLAAARSLLERAVDIYETELGPDHPDTVHAVDNLGFLLAVQGEYLAAAPLLQRALTTRQRVLDPDHISIADSLTNVAWLLQLKGELARARRLFEQGLAIDEQSRGPNHPGTAATLNALGGLLYEQGKFAEAGPLIERALAIREKILGPEHRSTAYSLNNLGLLRLAEGNLGEAERLLERALAIREREQLVGPNHPYTATSLNSLGLLRWAQGKAEAAKVLFQRALAIREKALGPDHPETAESLNNLGKLLHSQGELELSQPLFERALAIYQLRLGESHYKTLAVRQELASMLQRIT